LGRRHRCRAQRHRLHQRPCIESRSHWHSACRPPEALRSCRCRYWPLWVISPGLNAA
jgi:hypothetical protein